MDMTTTTSHNFPSQSAHPNSPSHRARRWKTVLVGGMAITSVVGLALAASSGNGATAQTSGSSTTAATTRSVIVNGVGRVTVTPDRMILSLGVETRSLRVADALKANNKAAQDLIKVLKDKGVAEKDIKTSQLSIYPQFDRDGRKITAYQVNNSVTATVRNIASSGDIIDAAAAGAGDAIRINGLEFGIGDPSPALASARDLAVKDAKAQAEQLARSAGVKLGKLRTIRSGSTPDEPSVLRQASVAADSAGAPISAGTQDVTASVELVYDIVE